jgi:hypothetical protein
MQYDTVDSPSNELCWEINPKLWQQFVAAKQKNTTNPVKKQVTFTEDYCVQWLDLNCSNSI